MRLEIIYENSASNAKSTPILFVHGMWHGAWCWADNFLPYFAEHGYAAYALSLRGHCGSENNKKLRWTTLNDYVQDVAQVASQMDKPVVVGHSMGGAIVQKYLEKHQAPAGVLVASCPPQGIISTSIRYFCHHPLPILKAVVSTRLYPIVGTPTIAKATLFSADMPEQEVKRHFDRLQDEAYLAYMGMMGLSLPRPKLIRAPILVLGAENDVVITPQQVEKTARTYGTRAEIFPNMAHDMMLEKGWKSVADRILSWLGGLELK